MIKYVIWDFNGTILDDKELSLTFKWNLKNKVKTVDEEAYLELCFNKEVLSKAELHLKESFDEIANGISRNINLLALI